MSGREALRDRRIIGPVLVGWFLVAAAAGMLWLGAELFVEHAAAAGWRLGVTGLAVGLLLAGAEPEELITAVIAATRESGGIAAGDAIGANITMLTAVLGLAALIRPIPVAGRVRRYLLGAALLGGVAALLLPGGVDRTQGLILVALYAAAAATVWILERRPPAIGELAELEEQPLSESNQPGWIGLLLAVGGITIMATGGWLAVLGAERLVTALGVADSVVGLSVVAAATSAELFALVVSSHRHAVTELAVAGVAGSVGYNATMTLGGAALVRPITTTGLTTAGWVAAALPLVILALGGKHGQLRRWAGAILAAGYITYLALLFLYT